jgi:hypothetical protein
LTPVDTSQVANNPSVDAVALTFETYFGGINSQNFPLAYSAYSSQYQGRVDEGQFAAQDDTSSDTGAVITAITAGGLGSTVVDVSFTSNQNAANGPVPGESCTDWTLAYTLVPGDTGSLTLLINSAAFIGPGHVGCPGQP